MGKNLSLRGQTVGSAFLNCPAPAARILGGFAPSSEAKYASLSGAPSPSYSERAASAFLNYIFSGADTPTIANAF
ncbi:hypothetical protein BM74_01525 [Bacillus thuringiensis]|uniref:Uncharacterized protein n=1 Tax=Bacillus thuringiensis TaxID=1428 RepID=A0A437SRC5_BACTU|nr:hypothetical protein BM74_01525 [Bacillus thuringiensis]